MRRRSTIDCERVLNHFIDLGTICSPHFHNDGDAPDSTHTLTHLINTSDLYLLKNKKILLASFPAVAAGRRPVFVNVECAKLKARQRTLEITGMFIIV